MIGPSTLVSYVTSTIAPAYPSNIWHHTCVVSISDSSMWSDAFMAHEVNELCANKYKVSCHFFSMHYECSVNMVWIWHNKVHLR